MNKVYIATNSPDLSSRMLDRAQAAAEAPLLVTYSPVLADVVIFSPDWKPSCEEERGELICLVGRTVTILQLSQGGEDTVRLTKNSLRQMLGLPSKPKLYICGHGRHGKTSAAKYLRDNFNCTFADSSRFACQKAVFPKLKDKYGYRTVEECYGDRHNHRAEWHDLIAEYCDNPSRLSEEIFDVSDIYVGIRSARELEESKHLSALVIWVDACGRIPPESSDSNKVTPSMCDVILTNNGTEDEFHEKLDRIGNLIFNR